MAELTESQKRVAEYEWGYAGTRPIPGTPALQPTPTVPVTYPHTRVYTEATPTQVTKLPMPTGKEVIAAESRRAGTLPGLDPKPRPATVSEIERATRMLEVPTTQAQLHTPYSAVKKQPWQEIRGKEKISAAVTIGAAMAERKESLGGVSPVFAEVYKRTTPEGVEYQVKSGELVAYEKEKKFLTELREEHPRVFFAGAVLSSAMLGASAGTAREAGFQVGDIGSVRLGLITEEERAEKILERATMRRTRWKADPIGVPVKALVSEEALLFGTGVVGKALIPFAKTYPTAAKYTVGAVKFAGFATVGKEMYAPIISGDLGEIGGKIGELAALGAISYYGFKGGIEEGLREQYLRELPAVKSGQVSLKEVKAELKLAERAGKLGVEDIRPFEEVLGEMEIMQRKGGRVGRVTQEILLEWEGRKIIGGSASTRAQIGSKRPADIDIYADMNKAFKEFATQKYWEAGIDVKPKGAGLYLGGEKLMDIHPLEMLTTKQYYTGTRFTPEGIEVMKYETQFFRKTLGKYEEPFKLGRGKKDIPDFSKMAASVIKTGRIEAAESIPILKQYRTAKVESFAQMFKDMGTKGYATYTAMPKFEVGVMALPIGIGYGAQKFEDPFKAFVSYPKAKKVRREPVYTRGIEPFKGITAVGYGGIGRDPFRLAMPMGYPMKPMPAPDISIPSITTPPSPPSGMRVWPRLSGAGIDPWKRRAPRKRKVKRPRRRARYVPSVLGQQWGRAYGMSIPRPPKFLGAQATGIRLPVGRKRKKTRRKGKKRASAKTRKRRYKNNFARALGI